MSEFNFSSMRFSARARNSLRTIKTRIGLRNNVICRMALSKSLSLPDDPPKRDKSEMSDLEIRQQTLLGDLERVFVVIFREKYGVKTSAEFNCLCEDHIERGVQQLLRSTAGVKNIAQFSERLE